MDDAMWERIERKRAQNAYFLRLEADAIESQKRPVQVKAPQGRAEKAPKVCTDCGQTMRRYRETLADRPGTVAPGSHGRCASCDKRRRRGPARPRKPRADTRPERCIDCDWPLRDHGRNADHPGTRRHHGKGRCQACWYAHTHPSSPETRRVVHDGSTHCIRCGVQLRGAATPKEQLPDAVLVGKRVTGGHLCRTCHVRERHPDRRPRFQRPDRCVDCGWTLRDSGRDSDHPGTRRHHSKGRCSSCTTRQRRAVGLPPRQAVHDGSTNCVRCGVQLRGTTVPPGALPGAVMVGKRVVGGHICKTCQARERRKAMPGKPRHTKRPERCIDCKVRLRPSGSLAKHHPGTKRHHSGGRCIGCFERRQRELLRGYQQQATM